MEFVFIGLCILWFFISVYLLLSSRRIKSLGELQVPSHLNLPSVSIVIPIRNEGSTLDAALSTIVQLDYEQLEIILVNDRSTDNTASIIRDFKKKFSLIKDVEVKVLPEGWLGKNNALYQGALLSNAEWILFTDADIHFERNSLQKSIGYCIDQKLDHLSIFPDPSSRSVMLNSILETFKIMFDIKMQPWRVRDMKSSYYIGIGAFNLVRRDIYFKSGSHAAISLRPDDDLKLGQMIKKHGGQPDVLYGGKELTVEWYSSVLEFIKGLMKNTFSTFDYKFYNVLIGLIGTLIVFVVPGSFIFFDNYIIKVCGVLILSFQFLLIFFGKGHSQKWWHFLLVPVAGIVMCYILLASSLSVLWRGGIIWRETFYSLKGLKGK